MKITKWICRYAFFAILLGLAVTWCVMCQQTINSINNSLNSVSYIDIVIDDFDTAVAMQENIGEFRGLQIKGIIAIAIIVVLLALLILWNIFGDKISDSVTTRVKNIRKKGKRIFVKKPKNVPAQTVGAEVVSAPVEQMTTKPTGMTEPVEEVAEIEAEASSPEIKHGGFCTKCGARYENSPRFCDKCGAEIKRI